MFWIALITVGGVLWWCWNLQAKLNKIIHTLDNNNGIKQVLENSHKENKIDRDKQNLKLDKIDGQHVTQDERSLKSDIEAKSKLDRIKETVDKIEMKLDKK